MLRREFRVTAPTEFQKIFRKGRRFTTDHFVIHVVNTKNDVDRFGFVVNNKVGKATSRNLVKRRLRAIAEEYVATHPATGKDIVVRALPTAAETNWEDVTREFRKVLDRLN